MIGVSVGDIIKLLDQIPIWKTVSALPKRVKELEERVAALESKPVGPAADACPLCGTGMKVTASRADPTFGIFGQQQRTLTCQNSECGHVETRKFDPNKQR